MLSPFERGLERCCLSLLLPGVTFISRQSCCLIERPYSEGENRMGPTTPGDAVILLCWRCDGERVIGGDRQISETRGKGGTL